jgi:hypothetical protein
VIPPQQHTAHARINLILGTGWLRLKPSADVSKKCILASWLLVFSTCALIAFMPLMERTLTWDRFLRGGQDFEFSILWIAAILCLVIVLSQHCRQRAIQLISILWESSAPHRAAQVVSFRIIRAMTSSFCTERLLIPSLSLYILPLQI